MPRILVVTNGPLCRNPRVVKEATELGHAGYDVTVLSVRNHAPSEPHDLALMADAPFRRETIDMLPGSGFASFARRLRTRLTRDAATRLGWLSINSMGPAAALLTRAQAHRADLTIVHNEIAHWAGARLLSEGRRVAADIEDWHSEDLLPAERRGRPLAIIRANERALLNRAAYTTTTSLALADALHARYGGTRPHVLTNSFPLQPDPRRTPNEPPAFFWFSQTIGPGRGLEKFLGSWARTTQPSRLVLLGEARDGYAEELLQAIPSTHRRSVSFRPLVAPEALPSVIAEHDIGLALEDSTIVNRDLTITNKILQYLNAGLAVVATPTAGQREVLAHAPASGLLLDFADVETSAHALDALIADRTMLAARQQAARRAAEQLYSWEREAPTLLAAVAAALVRPA
jgi:glycosyltransferase involved in cell wall biosynthesis